MKMALEMITGVAGLTIGYLAAMVVHRGKVEVGSIPISCTSNCPYKKGINKAKPCVDHYGNSFESQRAMCRFWDVNDSTFHSRIKRTGDLRYALTGIMSDGKS